MRWKFVVKRILSVLFYELINKGQTKTGLKKNLGFDCGCDPYRSIEGSVYYIEDNLDSLYNKAKEIYQNQGVEGLKKVLKKWYGFMDDLMQLSSEISKKDYSGKTDKELIKEFDQFVNYFCRFSSALMLPLSMGKLAEEMIMEYLEKKTAKTEEYFKILTACEKETQGTKELRSMLNMALKLKQGKDVDSDIKEHIKEFGWINTRGFFGDQWTQEDIKERLEYMLKEDLSSRLEILDKNLKETKEKTENILSEIDADDEFRKFIEFTKELVYFRTQRMDIFVKSGFLARTLFKEIGKRVNRDFHDFFNLLADEIRDVLIHKTDYSKQIAERKKGFGFFIENDKCFVLSGKELEEYKAKNIKEEIDKSIKEIKGKMACAGYAKGKVKILSSKYEINKVEKGDILVASMTTPDLIPAMEKAAAFVTDEGGILCHAAIISREMEKPCIIGTNIATKVLKDGDIVEVDADNAIVKIIKRK